MGEEAAVVADTDRHRTDPVRKKEFQVGTTFSYGRERMGAELNEAGTHQYLAREEGDHSKAIFHPTSQPRTEAPKAEGDSLTTTAPPPPPPPAVVPPASSSTKGNGEEYVWASSADETTRASVTESYKDDIEVSAFKPEVDSADDSWDPTPTTSAAWSVAAETSHESTFHSGSPDGPSQGYVKAPSGKLAPPKPEAPAVDGNVWYYNDTGNSAGKPTFPHASSAAVPYPRGPVLSQDTPAMAIEPLPHSSSTFAFSPTELSSSNPADLSVLSQTAQPVYSDGEEPLQPSYRSEGFPIVTPSLSAASPAFTLHAAPVFPSVGVSFASASSSSPWFDHLSMASPTSPQAAAAAAEGDKVSLHASVMLLLHHQSRLAQFSDVAALEPLPVGQGQDRTPWVSPVEPASHDRSMPAVSERADPFSGNSGGSRKTVAFRQGPSFSTSSSALVHELPAVSRVVDALLQPPSSLASATDLSEAYSGSEFLVPDADIWSHDSSGDLMSSTPGFNGDVPMPLNDGAYGQGREQQIAASFSETGSPAGSVIGTDRLAAVSRDESTQQDTAFLQAIRRVASRAKGNRSASPVPPVPPLHVATAAVSDALLESVLGAIAGRAFSSTTSSKILPPSAQQYLDETLNNKNRNNALPLPTPSQSSGDESLLRASLTVTVPRDPVLMGKSVRANHGSSTFDQIRHETAPESSTSAPKTANVPHITSNPTHFPGGLTISYTSAQDMSPSSLISEKMHQVIPLLHSNDALYRSTSLANTIGLPPKSVGSETTPLLPADRLLNTAPAANSHSLSSAPPKDRFLTFPPSANMVDFSVPVPELLSDSVHHDFTKAPETYISITSDYLRDDGDHRTRNHFLAPSKVASEFSTTPPSDPDLWEDYDGVLPVNGCHACVSHRETQEMVDPSVSTEPDPIANSHSETLEEEKEVDPETPVASEPLKHTTTLALDRKTKKHSAAAILDKRIQTVRHPLKHASQSKPRAVWASSEESGSGQGAADYLNVNETSTTVRFPNLNAPEGPIGAGNSALTSASPQSSVAPMPRDRSSLFNVSEAG